MGEDNENIIRIDEDEMFEIIVPLDAEKENIIEISQSEPDIS